MRQSSITINQLTCFDYILLFYSRYFALEFKLTAHDIIIKPLLSEKSLQGVEQKKYVFVVDNRATKIQIADAVEELFDGAKVDYVHTVKCKGKYKKQGRFAGYTSTFKKAYVQLKADSKGIAFFDSLN